MFFCIYLFTFWKMCVHMLFLSNRLLCTMYTSFRQKSMIWYTQKQTDPLTETNIFASENGWLVQIFSGFLLGPYDLFSGAGGQAVSFREWCSQIPSSNTTLKMLRLKSHQTIGRQVAHSWMNFMLGNPVWFFLLGRGQWGGGKRGLGLTWLSLKGPESRVYMDVSENSGFSPKSSILIRFSIINHPFWGTPILGNIHIEPVVHIAWWNPTSTDYVP